MGFAVQGLSTICAIVGLVCLVMVLIKMFQTDQTVLGIVCIVGICVCGVGYFVAFVVGWMNSTKWGIKNVMLAWTAALVLEIVLVIIGATTGAMDLQAQYKQLMPK